MNLFVNQVCRVSVLAAATFLACSGTLGADDPQSGSRTSHLFRFVTPASDSTTWKKVELAFREELTPDVATTGQNALDVYQYKVIDKICVIDHTALVVIRQQPAKVLTRDDEWDQFDSAYSFDLNSRQKTPIDHADRMWQWRYRGTHLLGPEPVPDVGFTYLTCTECEPDLMFSSFVYDAEATSWRMRVWGNGKDLWWVAADGLVVESDLSANDDMISFDCAYGFINSLREGFQDLAARCKELSYRQTDKARIDDTTVIFSPAGGKMERRNINSFDEVARVTEKICRTDGEAFLCKLPNYMTITSGQNSALDEMFPHAPDTVREVGPFRSLKLSMTMNEVVKRCGEPDEIGGSSVSIFIYHLRDGSLIAIGGNSATDRIKYVVHIYRNGKSKELVARN